MFGLQVARIIHAITNGHTYMNTHLKHHDLLI